MMSPRDFFLDLAAHPDKALKFGNGLFLKDGRDTPYFVNMGGYIGNGSGIHKLGSVYAYRIAQLMDEGLEVDMIAGPAIKGIPLVTTTAAALYAEYGIDLGVTFDRKVAKTHGEASGTVKMFEGRQLYNGVNILILDDVGTSMQTKIDFMALLDQEASRLRVKVNVSGILIGVDREQVGPVYDEDLKPEGAYLNSERIIRGARGDDAIQAFMDTTGKPVYSVIGVTEGMETLCDACAEVWFQHDPKNIERVKVTPQFLEEHFIPYMDVYGSDRRFQDR